MANYAASVLAEAQLILNDRFASPEKRLKTSGVIGSFLKNSSLAIPNIGDLRTKEERPEKAYFFNRSKRAATGGRSFNHTGTVGDSTEVALSYQQFKDVAQTSMKRSDNNVMAEAAILANELDNIFKNIHEEVDSAALTYLTTNKTTVNAGGPNGGFDGTTNVFEIHPDNLQRSIQYAKAMLRQNHYKGSYDAILDGLWYSEAEYLASQGNMNATNYGFQMGGVNFSEAQGYSDAGYTAGLGLWIPEGTIGVVDWIPVQNRRGEGDYDSVLGGYGTITDPYTGLQFAVHAYSQRADTSASGGDAQDVVKEWEVSVDLSFNKSPLSVAGESTIFEVGIKDPQAA